MTRAKRFGVALLLSGVMAGGMTTAASASVPAPAVPAVTDGQDFCEGLAELIAFLEGRPESRLRDYLLAVARHVFAAHCQVG